MVDSNLCAFVQVPLWKEFYFVEVEKDGHWTSFPLWLRDTKNQLVAPFLASFISILNNTQSCTRLT